MKSFKQKQSGFSLFMVMIIMLVIAFLVVVTSQSSSTESRISTNEADRKYALSLAENGLREGENYLGSLPNQIKASAANKPKFTVACTNGLCTPAEDVQIISSDGDYTVDTSGSTRSTPAWKREINGVSVFDSDATSKRVNASPRVSYIVEFLGERSASGGKIARYFRITSRAKGDNDNTTVTLQIHVEMLGT